MPRFFGKLIYRLGFSSLSHRRYSLDSRACCYSVRGPQRPIAMLSCVLSEGRLFGLAPFEWSVLLGGSVLCGLLTLFV
jgi:hypothetical protein